MDIALTDKQLIGDIYHASIDPERWTEVLDRMGQCLGAKGVVMLSLKGGDGGYRISRTNSLYHKSDALSVYAREYSHHEADVFRRVAECPPGTDIRDERFNDHTVDVRTYPDVRFLLDHCGVFERCGVRLSEDKGWFDAIAFQYAFDRGNASQEEFARLSLLRPHLTQALVQSRTFNPLRSHYNAVLGMLDKVDQALFLVTVSGQVAVANRTALDMLDQGDVLGIGRNGVLHPRDPESDAVFRQSVETVSATTDHEGIMSRVLVQLPRACGMHPCLAEISPLQDTDGEIIGGFHGAIVSIVDPQLRSAIDLDGLDVAYGLSATETIIARLMVDGLTNTQIAEHRGVTSETVKSQVRTLYVKTASKNRTEFVRRILQFNVPIQRPAKKGPPG